MPEQLSYLDLFKLQKEKALRLWSETTLRRFVQYLMKHRDIHVDRSFLERWHKDYGYYVNFVEETSEARAEHLFGWNL